MIDHAGIPVSDYALSQAFYQQQPTSFFDTDQIGWTRIKRH